MKFHKLSIRITQKCLPLSRNTAANIVGITLNSINSDFTLLPQVREQARNPMDEIAEEHRYG